ncbi:MAG: hypothetical protein FWD15_01125 [Alphaproteobacteria bacterium]|nr:hypothetical protein [Alphaproteobacteria bacterium]
MKKNTDKKQGFNGWNLRDERLIANLILLSSTEKCADKTLRGFFPDAKTDYEKTQILKRYYEFNIASGTGHKEDHHYYGLILAYLLSMVRDFGVNFVIRPKYRERADKAKNAKQR